MTNVFQELMNTFTQHSQDLEDIRILFEQGDFELGVDRLAQSTENLSNFALKMADLSRTLGSHSSMLISVVKQVVAGRNDSAVGVLISAKDQFDQIVS